MVESNINNSNVYSNQQPLINSAATTTTSSTAYGSGVIPKNQPHETMSNPHPATLSKHGSGSIVTNDISGQPIQLGQHNQQPLTQQPLAQQQHSSQTFIDSNQGRIVRPTEGGYTAVGLDPNRGQPLVQSISQGNIVPSNVTINGAIVKARQSLEYVHPSLNFQGRRLAKDADSVLESANYLLMTKNQDEKVQRLVQQATLAGKQDVQQTSMAGQMIRSDPHDTTGLARQTFGSARDVVLFLIRSSEFREFLIQIFQLFQSVVGDIKEKHGSDLKDGMRQDARSGVETLKQQQPAQQFNTTTTATTTTGFAGPANDYANAGFVQTEGITFQQQQQQQQQQFHHQHQQGRPSLETKSVLSNIGQDLRQGELGDEDMMRDIQLRAEQLLDTLSSHPQFNSAVSNILQIIDTWTYRMRMLKQDPNITPSSQWTNVQSDAFNLLCEFVPRQEIDYFINLARNLFYDLQNDANTRSFFRDLKSFMTHYASPNIAVDRELRKRQTNELINRARNLMNYEQVRHKSNFQTMFRMLVSMSDHIKNDAATRMFSQSVGQLARDFILDEQGRPDVFVAQESFKQLRYMLIPMIQRQLEAIPLPMIEGSTEKYDYSVQNLTLNGRDILPDNFDLKLVNNVHLGLGDMSATNNNRTMHKLKLRANNIRASFPAMAFYVHKKTFPRYEDQGIANVALLGTGLHLRITWALWTQENEPMTVELASVKVFIDKLAIDIVESRHRMLNKLALKLFSGAIKKKASQAIVDRIRSTVDPLNETLNDYFRREREGLRLRERANLRLKQAYDSRRDGTHVPLTQKVKQAAVNVTQQAAHAVEQVQNVSQHQVQPLQQQQQQHQSYSTNVIPTSGMNYTTVDRGDYSNISQNEYVEDVGSSDKRFSAPSSSMEQYRGSSNINNMMSNNNNNNFNNNLIENNMDRNMSTNVHINRTHGHTHEDMNQRPSYQTSEFKEVKKNVDHSSHSFNKTQELLEEKL